MTSAAPTTVMVGLVVAIHESFDDGVRDERGHDGGEVDAVGAPEIRAAARQAKDFAEADRIRAELDAMDIALKDARDSTTGELVPTWEVKR